MAVDRTCPGKVAGILRAAKEGTVEQLRRKDDLGAALGCLSHQGGDSIDVRLNVVYEVRLEDRDGDRRRCAAHPAPPRAAGCCWVMQWKAPPPESRALAGMPIVRRPGKSLAIAATASSSNAERYTGTATAWL